MNPTRPSIARLLPLYFALLFLSAATPTTERSAEAEQAIESILREAGKLIRPPLDKEALLKKHPAVADEIEEWLARYGESILDTRGGPFVRDKGSKVDYVSTYRGDRIYVHVLDWHGENNVVLPAVIDRRVKRAWMFGDDPPDTKYSWGMVRQSPWGMLVIDPSARKHRVIAMEIEGDPRELIQPRAVRQAAPDAVVRFRGETAALSSNLAYVPGPDWIEGWTQTGDQVAWKAVLPSAGDFDLALTYACPASADGRVLTITTPTEKHSFDLRETRGWAGDEQNFERRVLPVSLRLPAGSTVISMRVAEPGGGRTPVKIYSLELVSNAAKKAMEAAADRAIAQRTKAEWFANARYGLMVHWLPGTAPRNGPTKPFPEAVRDFDVDAFAEMVRGAGAPYVIFTAVHGIQWFPGPHSVYARVMPGRTCDRDLIKDLSEALTKRGVKLILYYHHGVGDHEWVAAAGFLRPDKSEFFENERQILEEIGRRYGAGVAGFWFDDRYPDQPFEQLYAATKAGNPDRIVAWNSWIMPKSTEFQDYYGGEAGNVLAAPTAGYFAGDGPAGGLQPHFLIMADDPWAHTKPDSEIAPPLYGDEELIRYVRAVNALGGPVTINIGVYQDGTASPATLKQVATLRRALDAAEER